MSTRPRFDRWYPRAAIWGAVLVFGFTAGAVTTSMVHVWTAPAYTNPLGVFAEANPALRCADGTYYISPACQTK